MIVVSKNIRRGMSNATLVSVYLPLPASKLHVSVWNFPWVLLLTELVCIEVYMYSVNCTRLPRECLSRAVTDVRALVINLLLP